MLRLLRVSGSSLSPIYQEGDFVLVAKIPSLFEAINRGDVFVFRHVTYGTMIKEVDHVSPNGDEIYVAGTHEYSVDSKRFGPIRKGDLIGKVIWHIKKPERSPSASIDSD